MSRNDPKAAGRISEHERIVDFRIVLIHGYDFVDDELVWDTIENKLPVLLAEAETLLEEHGDTKG